MKNFGPPTFGDADLVATEAVVEERRWGYILNAPGMTYAELNMMQRASLLVAAYLLSFSLGWATPVITGLTQGFDLMRVGLTLLFVASAFPFAWYASRGNRAYVYVNLYRNELREVVPNFIGKPTVLRRMPFSEIGGVRIEHKGVGGRAVLMLWQGGDWRSIAMLDGRRRELTSLRERLAKDLFDLQLERALPVAANLTRKAVSDRTDYVQFRRVA